MRDLRRATLLLALPCSFLLTACPAGEATDGKADEGKADDGKADEPDDKPEEPPADPPAPEIDLAGPVPPETSAVLFSVEGALIPLACFDQGKQKLLGGKDCLPLVKKGDEVFLGSDTGKVIEKITDPKNALCEVGDKPTSLGTPGLERGDSYSYGTFPKSLARVVEAATADNESDEATKLSDDETAKLNAAVLAKAKKAEKGTMRSTSKVEFDMDGDGTKETFFSIVVDHPTSTDQYLFSGLFMAKGGNLDQLVLLESTKKPDILRARGAVDLDGDGAKELWLGLTFEGGSADRVARMKGDKLEYLAKWTCGA